VTVNYVFYQIKSRAGFGYIICITKLKAVVKSFESTASIDIYMKAIAINRQIKYITPRINSLMRKLSSVNQS